MTWPTVLPHKRQLNKKRHLSWCHQKFSLSWVAWIKIVWLWHCHYSWWVRNQSLTLIQPGLFSAFRCCSCLTTSFFLPGFMTEKSTFGEIYWLMWVLLDQLSEPRWHCCCIVRITVSYWYFNHLYLFVKGFVKSSNPVFARVNNKTSVKCVAGRKLNLVLVTHSRSGGCWHIKLKALSLFSAGVVQVQ